MMIPLIKHFTNYNFLSGDITSIDISKTNNIMLQCSIPYADYIKENPYIEYTTVNNDVVTIHSEIIQEFSGKPVMSISVPVITDIKPDTSINLYAISNTVSTGVVNLNIKNCTVSPVVEKTFINGTSVKYTFTSTNEAIFENRPFITYNSYQYNQSGRKEGNFENDLHTQCSIVIDVNVYPDSIIEVNAKAKTDITYNICTIYNPTDKQLVELSQKRFSPQTTGGEAVDLGQFILSLRKVFLHFEQGNEGLIILGDYNTTLECNVIENDVIDVSLGTQIIHGMYQNSLDYTDTIVELHIPFVDVQTIEAYKIIDKEIEIIYRCNLYQGTAIVLLKDVSNGDIIHTVNASIGYEIPYILRLQGNIQKLGDMSNNENLCLIQTTPKIRLINHNVIDKDVLEYGTDTIKYGCINQDKGYFIIEDIHTDFIINDSELELLKNCLSQGIKII